ncbi:MAG: TIGR04255 family protein [Terriglobales bacterium]
MAKLRAHLRNAPIEEAIIEFRVRPRQGLQLRDLEPLVEPLRSRYPDITELREAQFLAGRENGPDISSQAQRRLGWRLCSSDKHFVVRVCLDQLAFSRLRPYTTWAEVSDEGFALWQSYAKLAQPAEVTRLGVRYINKLELPNAQLNEYLTAPPVLPEQAAGGHEVLQYLTRILVNDVTRSCKAVVTQASGVVPPPDKLQILLDIDAFREGPWPVPEVTRDELEPLRLLKNELFFSHLQESVVSRYE